ncbi:cytochrome P450 [Lactarius indigo]|nr:cytochrome P450 [Lactarius indigo]
MQLSLLTAIDSLALFGLLYLLLAFRDHRRRRGRLYPPGPPSWPIIGNLLDVPKLSPWLAYADMSKKYGDVICIQVLGQVVVVLCSPTAIKELLERRGELYADRMPFPIYEIMGVDWILPIVRKGKYWRDGRKLLDRSLRPGETALRLSMIEEKTRIFLSQLLSKPKDFREHVDQLQGKLIMHLAYGYDLKENDDILVPAMRTSEIMSRLSLPGAALVNNFPFLQRLPSWVPFFKYEPLASECRELGLRMKNEPMDFVKNSMRDGTAVPSLASEFLQDAELLSGPERQWAEEVITNTLGSMFQGEFIACLSGANAHSAHRKHQPTVSTMSSLFLALVLYPEVQKRAQEELDSVISRDRLPTYDDKPRLPYIEAMSKELLRWHMVAPMGGPHSSTDDDVYRGYFIPKGSMIIADAWAVLHNPELYPDPEAFNPGRFLYEDGSFRDDPAIQLAFGVGRRICPGRHFVAATLFVVTASVLSVFDVTRAKDKNRNEIPIAVAGTSANFLPDSHVPQFECAITPRDNLAEDLIRASGLA